MCAWITIVTTAIPVALSHSVRNYQYHGNAGTACVFSTEEEVWSLVGFQVSFSHSTEKNYYFVTWLKKFNFYKGGEKEYFSILPRHPLYLLYIIEY